MKRKWLIAAGMLLSFALTTHAQDKNFHIYLCIGQSNMVGAASRLCCGCSFPVA